MNEPQVLTVTRIAELRGTGRSEVCNLVTTGKITPLTTGRKASSRPKEGREMSGKSTAPDRSGKVFILAGTSPEYSSARQTLGIAPAGAYWLTGPLLLTGVQRPKVYRFGSWRTLTRIRKIEAAMQAAEAEVIDLT